MFAGSCSPKQPSRSMSGLPVEVNRHGRRTIPRDTVVVNTVSGGTCPLIALSQQPIRGKRGLCLGARAATGTWD